MSEPVTDTLERTVLVGDRCGKKAAAVQMTLQIGLNHKYNCRRKEREWAGYTKAEA